MSKKSVIVILDGDRHSFHMETPHATQYMCSAGILEATVYSNGREAKKVIAQTESKGEYRVVPYHWGLDVGMLQCEDLITRIQLADESEFQNDWSKEEAVKYYQRQLHQMRLLYAEEVPPKCLGCKKTPDKILEYVSGAKVAEMSPAEYVITSEGTFNRFGRNGFYCTDCYIKHGMPTIR
jgi:hypothetical protein